MASVDSNSDFLHDLIDEKPLTTSDLGKTLVSYEVAKMLFEDVATVGDDPEDPRDTMFEIDSSEELVTKALAELNKLGPPAQEPPAHVFFNTGTEKKLKFEVDGRDGFLHVHWCGDKADTHTIICTDQED